MSTLEILRAARERLADPKMWKKTGGVDEGGRCCVGLALEEVSRFGVNEIEAYKALARVVGWEPEDEHETGYPRAIYDWNDDPERTHADVLAALDTAIANEEAKVVA